MVAETLGMIAQRGRDDSALFLVIAKHEKGVTGSALLKTGGTYADEAYFREYCIFPMIRLITVLTIVCLTHIAQYTRLTQNNIDIEDSLSLLLIFIVMQSLVNNVHRGQ